jgi:hypothetical protein
MWQKLRTQSSYNSFPRFCPDDYILIYTHCQELLKSVGSHCSCHCFSWWKWWSEWISEQLSWGYDFRVCSSERAFLRTERSCMCCISQLPRGPWFSHEDLAHLSNTKWASFLEHYFPPPDLGKFPFWLGSYGLTRHYTPPTRMLHSYLFSFPYPTPPLCSPHRQHTDYMLPPGCFTLALLKRKTKLIFIKGYPLKILLKKTRGLLNKKKFLFGISAFGVFRMILYKVL